jgi:acetylornithine deacetylase/succinyl-diaminopimelate desuccinylase-like protein
MTDVEALRQQVAASMPEVRRNLERLVRIPSVSASGYDAEPVRASAETTAEILNDAGLPARVVDAGGGHPAVIGSIPAPGGAPTVLLYAHHDVQPTGPAELWSTPPFEPTERDGRLYGRGAADDKAGVMVHAAAIRAWEGKPPVGVSVFIEGEEEAGSDHLPELLARYGDDLRCDAVILADSSNWRIGQPALTTSLRGLAGVTIEVRTLDHAVHSGMYGGPIPDALTSLCRTLAGLHDERGNVAIAGLKSEPSDPLDLTESDLRAWAGVRPGVQMIGEGGLTERLWTKPAAYVLAIDAPRTTEAPGQLVPSARATVGLRVAPNDSAADAVGALVDHLKASVPWGAELTILASFSGEPYRVDAEGPVYDAARQGFADAWGVPPVDIGVGGSIPFVSMFRQAFPGAAILLTGVEDPSSNAHSENESLDLGEFERACLAETLFLAHLAATRA